jgi:PhnB protein
MAKITAYLTFDGNCREAMEFYKACFGGELTVMSAGESPMGGQFSPGLRDKVMHADLRSGELKLMASDNLMEPGSGAKPGNMISLMLECGSEAELRAAFKLLAAGGRVGQEPKLEFWGSFYADLSDKFGLRWMLNWDKPKAG